MSLTSPESLWENISWIPHVSTPLISYASFTQYPKVGYTWLDPDQIDLRERVLRASGGWRTSTDPIWSLKGLNFLTFEKWWAWLFSLDEKKTIFDQFWHIARIGHALIASCNTWDINNLGQHRTNIESTITYSYNVIIWYENNLDFLRELTLCRSSFIRNDICVLLISFVEYLCLSGDYGAARKWHTRALKITQVLSAPQYYIELMRDLYVRFPEYMEPTSSIQEHANHGQIFTQSLDDAFYQIKVYQTQNSTEGVTSRILDEAAMNEKNMRSQRNHNQSDLLSLLAYFRIWNLESDSVEKLQKKISEFERMKDGYIQAISESGKPYSATYEIGDAIMLHKIEHSIAQALLKIVDGRLVIDSKFSRYIDNTFWLPDIASEGWIDTTSKVHERSIIFWKWLQALRIDLRVPMIQSLANATRYSTSSALVASSRWEDELRYRIGKMIVGHSPDIELKIKDYLNRNRDNPEIRLFILSWLPRYTAENFPTYLSQLLLKDYRIIREFFSEYFFGWEWILTLDIAPGSEQIVDSSSPQNSWGKKLVQQWIHRPLSSSMSPKISLWKNMFLRGTWPIHPLMRNLVINPELHQLIIWAYASRRDHILLEFARESHIARERASQQISITEFKISEILLNLEFGVTSNSDSITDALQMAVRGLRILLNSPK